MPLLAHTIDTTETSLRERQAVRVIALCATLVATLAMTLGREPGAPIPTLFPSIVGAIVITEVLAAVVLFQQFLASRFAPLAMHAAAYLTSAVLIVPYFLTSRRCLLRTGSGARTIKAR